MSLQKLTKRNK